MPFPHSTAAIIDNAPLHLTMRIGEADFTPVGTCILGLALSVAFISAYNLWRIGQREFRTERLALYSWPDRAQRGRPERFSWHYRLGGILAATWIISGKRQERLRKALAAAGIHGPNRLSEAIGVKACTSTGFAILCGLILEYSQLVTASVIVGMAGVAASGIAGWQLPELVLSRLAGHRRRVLERGLPDTLDLLVICTEAGLSLDQALDQVSRDIRPFNQEMSQELAATVAEMRVSPNRGQALDNLADRAGVSSLRSIVAVLNQSIKFGTPLAVSLRFLAADMRTERQARLEERAARLPSLLSIPLMTLILPSLLIVICTPLVLHIIDMLRHIAAAGR